MRPLEQYATLRRGRKILLQQENEEWRHRTATLRKWSHMFAHWLGLHLILWGYRLQRVGTPSNVPSYKR
jgi:hypothetical protein